MENSMRSEHRLATLAMHHVRHGIGAESLQVAPKSGCHL